MRPEEFEDYKEKEAKRKKLNRSNEKVVPGPVKAHRLVLNRQRAAKCRAKAKQGASMVTTPDLSEQVVGKAVSRLRQALPKSPQRHFTVVKKLAETMDLLEPEFQKISHVYVCITRTLCCYVKHFIKLLSIVFK